MDESLREKIELFAPHFKVPAYNALALAEFHCGGIPFRSISDPQIVKEIKKCERASELSATHIARTLVDCFDKDQIPALQFAAGRPRTEDHKLRVLLRFQYGICAVKPTEIINALNMSASESMWYQVIQKFGLSLEMQVDYMLRKMAAIQDQLEARDHFMVAYGAHLIGYHGHVVSPTPEARILAQLAAKYRGPKPEETDDEDNNTSGYVQRDREPDPPGGLVRPHSARRTRS